MSAPLDAHMYVEKKQQKLNENNTLMHHSTRCAPAGFFYCGVSIAFRCYALRFTVTVTDLHINRKCFLLHLYAIVVTTLHEIVYSFSGRRRVAGRE